MNDLDWKLPALVGGIITGILSAIPGVSLVNCCFCAWPLIGGAVAAKLLITRSPRPVKTGEGAQVGLMAGLVAAGIYLLINFFLLIAGIGEGFQRWLLRALEQSSDQQVQEMAKRMLDMIADQTTGQKLAGAIPVLIIFAVIYGGFTVLGGLLGVALFEKRKGQFPPSQYPPNYPPQGGGYGGGGYGGAQESQYPPNFPPQGGSYGEGGQGGQSG